MIYFGLKEKKSARRRFAAVGNSGQNFQWKRCDNDADFAVLDLANNPVRSAAHVVEGGIFIPAYFSSRTENAATNPASVINQTIIKNLCIELGIQDFSDNFNAPTIDTSRWNTLVNSPVQTGGEMTMSNTGGNTEANNFLLPAVAAGFIWTIDWNTTHNEVGGRTGGNGAQWATAIGTDCQKRINSAGVEEFVANIFGGGETTISATGKNDGTFRMREDAGTFFCEVESPKGSGFVLIKSKVTASLPNRAKMILFNDGSNGGTSECRWDNFVIA